jgi:hypothetical protein
MEPLGLVLVMVIALSSLAQAALLLVLARGALQLSRRVSDLQVRVDREIRPALDNLARLSRNVAEVSDLAALQARRFDALVADTLDRVEEVKGQLRRAAHAPLGAASALATLVRSWRRGLDVYQRLGSHDAERRGKSRRYRDDEHWFI